MKGEDGGLKRNARERDEMKGRLGGMAWFNSRYLE